MDVFCFKHAPFCGKKFFILRTLNLIAGTASAAPGWQPYPAWFGKRYRLTDPKSYQEAREECVEEGFGLVSIASAQQLYDAGHSLPSRILQGGSPLWVGMLFQGQASNSTAVADNPLYYTEINDTKVAWEDGEHVVFGNMSRLQ